MCCASDNRNYMCHTCAKEFFLIRALIKQLLTEYQIFTILPQISHFHKYRNFSSIFATFLNQLLHPYKFYGSDMSGILFFIFASCEPLSFTFTNSQFLCLIYFSNALLLHTILSFTFTNSQSLCLIYCSNALLLHTICHTRCKKDVKCPK